MPFNCKTNTVAKAITTMPATTAKAIRVDLLVFFFTGLTDEFTIVFSVVAGSVNATLGVFGAVLSTGIEIALPIEPGTGSAALNGAFNSSSTGSGAFGGAGIVIGSVAATIPPPVGVKTGFTGAGCAPGLIIGFTGATGGTGATGCAGCTVCVGCTGCASGCAGCTDCDCGCTGNPPGCGAVTGGIVTGAGPGVGSGIGVGTGFWFIVGSISLFLVIFRIYF